MKKNSTIASINTDDYNRFNKFLRKHNAFFNYYANVTNEISIVRNSGKASYFFKAFIWQESKQRHCYWSIINAAWEKEIGYV